MSAAAAVMPAPLLTTIDRHVEASSSIRVTQADALGREAARRFDIDPLTGFMPSREPVRRLTGLGECWEEAWEASSSLILHSGNREALAWRARVENMPIRRDISFLNDTRHQYRARGVLVYLLNRYCLCVPPTEEIPVVANSIAVPLMMLCELLDMPPVIAYADSDLYNWRFVDPAQGYKIENLELTLSFTNTRSEAHFMILPLFIEKAGAAALQLMPLVLDELAHRDSSLERIAAQLTEIARIMDECTTILSKMSPTCIPSHFYYVQRPWMNGGPRILNGKLCDFGGPSAGQSSLIHAFDLFLGIDHTPREPETGGFEATFMHRMSGYMPAPHRAYLIELGRASPLLRAYALEHRCGIVADAYDACIQSLKRLREGHMKIVWAYVIRFAKADAKKLNPDVNEDEVEARGTGGSSAAKFLQLTRARTIEALVE